MMDYWLDLTSLGFIEIYHHAIIIVKRITAASIQGTQPYCLMLLILNLTHANII
jgi:hypothetical protein